MRIGMTCFQAPLLAMLALSATAAVGFNALASAVAPALMAPAPTADKDHQWAEGIPFTTDWDAAIKEAKQTGKILFIYNGWQKPGI